MPTATLDKSRVRELKGHLARTVDEIDRLSSAWKFEEGTGGESGFALSPEEHKAYLDEVRKADEIRALIDGETKRVDYRAFLDAPEGTDPAAATDAAATQAAGLGLYSTKSLSDLYIDSDEWKAMKSSGFRDLSRVFGLEGRDLISLSRKDVFSMSAGTVSLQAFGSPQQVDLVERQRRPTRVRDLFPVARTNAPVLYGIRESGWTNNAAAVPQRRAADGVSAPTGGPSDVFGLKPTSNVTFTTVTYPVATIAHLIHIHKTVLDDEPRLRGIIDRDMIDGVKLAEDWELLYGDGVGENITGLVNTPGVQTYTQQATDKRTAALRRAITRVALAYYEPSGVVLHPLDWEGIELETDGNGAYRVAVSVAIGAEKRVWRLTVAETTAILQGKFLVGAFGSGSKVYDRELVNIAVSTENKDNFERNAVTVRCEERLALEVPRPESHVYGSFLADADQPTP